MIAFLHWLRSILVGTLNGIAKFALVLVILFAVLIVIGLAHGDGMPGNIVLGLDLRQPMQDSAARSPFDFGDRKPTVMNVVLALDAAERDSRVKGVFIRVGTGGMSVPQAEEVGQALQRFRKSGKFVIAHSQGFENPSLGDYLVASSASEIWMQPKSMFGASGEGGGAIFLRGLFDKIQAEPQITKRAEYKSAADMFMEKDFTPANREETTEFLQSWYNAATGGAAAGRKLTPQAVAAAFNASPQFAETAKRAGLIDALGYDDDAKQAALTKAGAGAKIVSIADYGDAKSRATQFGDGPRVALIQAAGEIVDGSAGGGPFGGDSVIAGDDLSQAIRDATKDKDIKAIILRVDSPGGSVTASDQILNAVRKAQAAGKPVVVSMGTLAASGGYYISCTANKIVAEPGTLTGSIGVLTGKVSVGKSLELVGVTAKDIGVGRNALMDSSLTPYTDEQWANLNAQADAIYADFTQKVAAGRKLPLAKVQDIARGRVWTGADAKPRGLVDQLGGFWTAVADVKQLAGIGAGQRVDFQLYPKTKGFWHAFNSMFSTTGATMKAMEGFNTLMSSPAARMVMRATGDFPRGGVEMRATNLPDSAY
ncbi:MAG TPA: signal peptide peptidase SppA [Rhizomicrobium sp.]|jgi:protease-4|nr:signal peptide peptidase SppA [Rhizomicrobium sp.]